MIPSPRALLLATLIAAGPIPAASAAEDWPAHGRSDDEQRFSPLAQIDAGSVDRLGLAWYADLGSDRGQEATPIEVDGTIYVSTAWNVVEAFDAATGKPLWSYDPEVPRRWLVNACCDAVSRGVAVWRGKVFAATLDGRLIALDAASGGLLWSTVTVDQAKPYTITGAPRVVKGKVLIGNAGAEYGVRGYVSAYEADSGRLAWRFYTVPGDPARPAESPALAAAAASWSGEWWRLGGGGTVWDSMAYDPALDLLYIGTGNGGPWNRKIRSDGKGDNLFLSSIVALRPDSGAYVWHYQVTPGDEWDYTATQPIILADLEIGGRPRKVPLQAPKNGFFYVLDRETGEFLSAAPYMPLNWASGIDPRTGRPIENPEARYSESGRSWAGMPGAVGGHSWYPMSYSPRTGLVYFPAQEVGTIYTPSARFTPTPTGWNLGVDPPAPLPADGALLDRIRASMKGYLLAWDPVAQREAWRVDLGRPFNGGTLATAGDLVFEGDANGLLSAYRAGDGAPLWRFDAQTAITAAPISYAVDGVQYVAVMAGWGGLPALGPGKLVNQARTSRNISRLLVFRLGGTARLPAPPPAEARSRPAVALSYSAAEAAAGQPVFAKYCSVCHGADADSAGMVPDLRYSAALSREPFEEIVLRGALGAAGMVSFASALSAGEIESVRNYLIREAGGTDQPVLP